MGTDTYCYQARFTRHKMKVVLLLLHLLAFSHSDPDPDTVVHVHLHQEDGQGGNQNTGGGKDYSLNYGKSGQIGGLDYGGQTQDRMTDYRSYDYGSRPPRDGEWKIGHCKTGKWKNNQNKKVYCKCVKRCSQGDKKCQAACNGLTVRTPAKIPPPNRLSGTSVDYLHG